MQKITETIPTDGAWVITHCDCHGTEKEDGLYHELEREDEDKPWHCPNCNRTAAQILGLT